MCECDVGEQAWQALEGSLKLQIHQQQQQLADATSRQQAATEQSQKVALDHHQSYMSMSRDRAAEAISLQQQICTLIAKAQEAANDYDASRAREDALLIEHDALSSKVQSVRAHTSRLLREVCAVKAALAQESLAVGLLLKVPDKNTI